jgi:predicted nuclease with RNAse H fold
MLAICFFKKGIFVLQDNNFRLISQFSANEHTTEVCKNVILDPILNF